MEKISVSIRVRPLNKQEVSKGCPWKVDANTISLCNTQGTPIGGQSFVFDSVFNTGNGTKDIYETNTRDIVTSTVDGFNGTVFAYGQTSSGKTHTMRGTDQEPGIIPRAVYDVFEKLQEAQGREFLLRVSYMEIYNEEINDLLAPGNRKLQVHENLERGIFVGGLREEIVVSAEQVLELMKAGEAHRHIGETNMNQESSRSHTIFRMVIESRDRTNDNQERSTEERDCDAVRVSALTLVDLAGSERVAKTGAEGTRMKEGTHINKSLMTLGTVINKLSEGAEKHGGHIPYRDSKLTRILQPALGGNAKTAIICTITPALMHVDETRGTLQFATRAKRVQNCATVNEVMSDAALLKRQKREIEDLRRKLQVSNSDHMEEEINKLRNALLNIEVERERMALELQDDRAARAEAERRIREQEQTIENLKKFNCVVVEDVVLEKKPKKGNRRETWCPRVFNGDQLGFPLQELPQPLPLPRKAKKFLPAAPMLEEEEEEPAEDEDLSEEGVKSPLVTVTSRRSSARLSEGNSTAEFDDFADPPLELQKKYECLQQELQAKEKEWLSEKQRLQADLTASKEELQQQVLRASALEEKHKQTSNERRCRSMDGVEAAAGHGPEALRELRVLVKSLEAEKACMEREIDDLTEQLKARTLESKGELLTLQGELDEARASCQAAQAELAALKAERPVKEDDHHNISKLQEEIHRLQEELLKSAAQADPARCHSDMDRLTQVAIETREAKRPASSEALDVLQEPAEDGEGNLEQLLADKAQLEDILAEAEEREAELVSQVETLTEQLKQNEKDRGGLESQVEDLQRRWAVLTQQSETGLKQALLVTSEETQSEIQSLTSELNHLRETVALFEVQKRDLEAVVKQKDLELGQVSLKLQQTLEDLEKALSECSKEELKRLSEDKERLQAEGHKALQEQERLGEALAVLGKEKNELERDLEEARQQVHKLKAELAESADKIVGLQEDAQVKHDIVTDLKMEKEKLREKLEAADKAVQDAQLELADVQAQLRSVTSEKVTFKTTLEKEQQARRADMARTQQEYQATLTETNLRLTQLEADKQGLEQALSAAQVEVKALDADLVAQDEGRKKAEEMLSEAEGRLQELSKELETARGAKEEMEGILREAEDAAQESARVIAERDGLCAQVTQELLALEAKKELLAQRLAELESKLSAQCTIASEAHKELESSRQKHLQETSALRTELASARKELQAAKALPAALEKGKEAARKDMEKLRTKLKDTEAKLKSALQDKSNLLAEKANSDREIKRLRGQSNLLEKDMSRRESLAIKSRESMAHGLNQTKTVLSTVQSQLQAKNIELEKLNFELQMMQTSNDTLQVTIAELEGEKEALLSQVSGLEAEAEVSAADISRQGFEIERLQQEVEQTRRDCVTLDAELENLKGDHLAVIEKLKQTEEALTLAEAAGAELERVKQELAQVMEQLTEAHFQFEEDKATCAAKERQLLEEKAKLEEQLHQSLACTADLEARLQTVQGQESKTSAAFEAAQNERKALQEDVEKLTCELAEQQRLLTNEKEEKVQKLQTEITSMELQVVELESQLDRTAQNLSAARHSSEEKARAAEKREQKLKDMLQESMAQLLEARAASEAAEKQLAEETEGFSEVARDLQTALDFSNSQITTLRRNVESSEAQVTTLTASLKLSRQECEALTVNLETILESKDNDHAEQLKAMQDREDHLAAKCLALERDLVEFERERKALQEKTQTTEAELVAVKKANLQKHIEEQGLWEQELRQALSQSDALKVKLEVAKKQTDALEKSVQEAHNKLAESLAGKQEGVAALQEALQKAEDKCRGLTKAVNAAEAEKVQAVPRLKALDESLLVERQAAEGLREQLAAAGKAAKDLELEAETLRLDLEAERKSKSTQSHEALQHAKLMKEKEGLIAKSTELNDEIDLLRKELQDQELEKDRLVLEVTEQNRSLQLRLRNAEEQIQRARHWKEDSRKLREIEESGQTELQKLQVTVEELEAEREHLRGQLSRAADELAKLRNRKSLIPNAEEHAALQDRMLALAKELSDYKHRCRSADKKVIELRKAVEGKGGSMAAFAEHEALAELKVQAESMKQRQSRLELQLAKVEEALVRVRTERDQLRSKVQELALKNCRLSQSEALLQQQVILTPESASLGSKLTPPAGNIAGTGRPPLSPQENTVSKPPSSGSDYSKHKSSRHSLDTERCSLKDTLSSTSGDKENRLPF